MDLNVAREVFEASDDFTVGIEEEFQILDAESLSLVQRFEELYESCLADEGKIGEPVGERTQLRVRPYSDLGKVVDEEDIVVGVLAVPTDSAQSVADDLVESGVKIIFNYSEALVQVPPDVTVHTSSPAVDLLYALYFYLT